MWALFFFLFPLPPRLSIRKRFSLINFSHCMVIGVVNCEDQWNQIIRSILLIFHPLELNHWSVSSIYRKKKQTILFYQINFLISKKKTDHSLSSFTSNLRDKHTFAWVALKDNMKACPCKLSTVYILKFNIPRII